MKINSTILLIVILLLIASPLLWLIGYNDYYYIHKYKGGYIKTQGKFLYYQITGGRRATSTETHYFDVQYSVNGKNYICTDMCWGTYSSNDSFDWLKDAYEKKYVDVYYIPGSPEISVLDPDGRYGKVTPMVSNMSLGCLYAAIILTIIFFVKIFIETDPSKKNEES